MIRRKILLITDLYPSFSDQSIRETSYALHLFAQDWCWLGHDVRVLKPVDFLRTRINIVTDVAGIKVKHLRCLRIPGTERWLLPPLGGLYQKMDFYPDVLLCHIDIALLIGRSLKKKWGTPLIFGVHQSTLANLSKIKNFAGIIDGFAFRSPTLKKRFEVSCSIEGPREIVNSGISEDLIVSHKEKRSFGKKIRFISLCSLIPLKNIDVTLKALAELKNEIEFTYTVVGDGPERNSLEKLSEELGLKPIVSFVGMKSHNASIEFLDNADVFIMVSAPETFGLAYLEALARGLIVVGAKGWGIDGIIENGISGYLCEPRNVDALADILRCIYQQDQQKVWEKSSELIRNLTRSAMAKRYLFFIDEILSK